MVILVPTHFLLYGLLFTVGRKFLISATTLTALSAATFHIIVIDTASGFLHTGLQLADTVAKADTKATALITAAALRQEVFTHSGIIIRTILLEDIDYIGTHCKAVFDERAVHTQAIVIISRSLTLQADIRSTSSGIQTGTYLQWESVLDTTV